MNDKRVNIIKVRLTDRQLCDLSNMAEVADRSPGDMAYIILTKYIYGHHAPVMCGDKGHNEAELAHHPRRRASDAID